MYKTLQEVTLEHFVKVYNDLGGYVDAVAKTLDISARTVRNYKKKCKELNIELVKREPRVYGMPSNEERLKYLDRRRPDSVVRAKHKVR